MFISLKKLYVEYAGFMIWIIYKKRNDINWHDINWKEHYRSTNLHKKKYTFYNSVNLLHPCSFTFLEYIQTYFYVYIEKILDMFRKKAPTKKITKDQNTNITQKKSINKMIIKGVGANRPTSRLLNLMYLGKSMFCNVFIYSL